ncbi:hypothetical protein PDIG_39050 [Penicillium digitatum PHI26]|uniref:Zn(2)-C6 fungal-type domain-containing protein n=2 Tax=Penicillium digitatum TaxID=36651 RepID=K9GEV8_PEND2|nr:hypothetical protein PDIP_24620 [Penicillium digitatum Pd1]EKV13293.1 hypothetical protein PDIG_39050 [Penicillium digitatum PHI26]EKV19194.1 hypothetical protein PDIP_24620 [Penicillium digitatum Pd1]
MNATIYSVKRRACVACTTAKAKCTPQAVNICQRCARLGKSCTYLDLPQTKRKRRATPSRVEVLEKKVDQLTSQLAALTQQSGQAPPETCNPLTNDLGSSCDPELDSTNIAALLDVAQDPSHGLDPPTTSILAGQPSIVDQGLLSETEAERLVATFQLDLVPKFPFVLITHDETAARLREQEPFLFLCVVAATMGSVHPLRKTVTEEIMKHVTLRVVARSERNLELLRGLLVHIACLCGTLGRPTFMKHDSRIEECIESVVSTEDLSDRWIAPLIHIQSFLATVDEVYASMQASDGRALFQVTRGSLQRQFESVRACVEKDISNCPSSIENAIRIEIKYTEIRLEELSLREDLWITEPASAVRTTMLIGIIQRSKELIQTTRNLPVSEIAQITIITSARICAAVGCMPAAVLTLLNLTTGSTESAMEAQVQAVVDLAEYPNLVIELAKALETKCEGMSAADKETDIVGSLCSKMRLLARCYPYQIRAIVGSIPSQNLRQDASVMAVPANEVAMTPQVWPDGSTYGDLGDMFPIDDTQWDSLLSDFTGFNYLI